MLDEQPALRPGDVFWSVDGVRCKVVRADEPDGLTMRQLETWKYIRKYIDDFGVSPSFAQIAEEVGMSKSNAHRIITALENRGAIEREVGHARSIRIT